MLLWAITVRPGRVLVLSYWTSVLSAVVHNYYYVQPYEFPLGAPGTSLWESWGSRQLLASQAICGSAVAGAKTWVWQEFGMDGIRLLAEAEEILAKLSRSSKGERGTRSTLPSELLTKTECTVGVEGIINSTNMHYMEEAVLEDLEEGSLITGVEVTEAVKQLRSSRAPGVHKIP